MKKRNQIFGIIAMLCVGMLFTSCHKDEKIAMKLSGEWEGYWGMYYTDENGNQYDSYQSSVVFYPDEKYDTKGQDTKSTGTGERMVVPTRRCSTRSRGMWIKRSST